ncbi:hexapeptide transferase family protein [Geoanaerobacter pelophilus]|uniref:Hexapeptide transferase family protein n=1 Tax=Geoanaerobacter pelophilus TaxID=60036 RepID=A0ABQ0MFU7_9BACT|nr:sugar-transfer associated ATP-grasp domain-containing protein [Geoanaerobacter pelophilus]GAW65980.1 hexapeptide transferase family protein [Geoanaerobacter pelophilus]
MRLIEPGSSGKIDAIYTKVIASASQLGDTLTPYLRRFIRFLALPYYFFCCIDWKICRKNKLAVCLDLLYIFFVLKHYPDNYFYCRFWEKKREEWKYYFGSIYDAYQRRQFKKYIYNRENFVLFANKQICYQLCHDAGFPLPPQFGTLYPHEDYRSRLAACLAQTPPGERLIVKAVDGMGGRGIVVAFRDGDGVKVRRNDTVCDLAQFELNHPAVVQQYVRQHHLVQQFSPTTNTIRLSTMLKSDYSGVVLVCAIMRFGVGGSAVDNLCSGGVAVGVDLTTGRLGEFAVGFAGKLHARHPDSGLPFKDFQIPYWPEVVELAKRVQQHFHYHKLLGLDLCITEEGPLLIEINEEQDLGGTEMVYGPVLKNPEVLDQFKAYNLLVSRVQHKM